MIKVEGSFPNPAAEPAPNPVPAKPAPKPKPKKPERDWYHGQTRALQIVDENDAVVNERTYRFGVDDDNVPQLRGHLEKILNQWVASGALYGSTLRVIDVPAPKR